MHGFGIEASASREDGCAYSALCLRVKSRMVDGLCIKSSTYNWLLRAKRLLVLIGLLVTASLLRAVSCNLYLLRFWNACLRHSLEYIVEHSFKISQSLFHLCKSTGSNNNVVIS